MPLYGQEHVDRYLATDGAEGHDWNGTQALILLRRAAARASSARRR